VLKVNISRLTAILLALLVAATVTRATLAQAPGMPPRGTGNIAVIDVAYIFKNHARFKQTVDAMKDEIERVEAVLKKERNEINALAEQLKTFNPGTPEYKRMQADLVQRQADFQAKATVQRNDFMERESKIYYNVYREIETVVRDFAMQNGISLVVRFNGDPVDASSREDILRGINRPIVYVEPRLDITPDILKILNRSAVHGTGPAPVTNAPHGVRPRPN
jgi:Skp family chaperone for outer membrane proteins